MRTKRTYISPAIKNMQFDMGNFMAEIFSGGDPVTGIAIDEEGDGSDGGNRANGWNNNIWE